MLHIDWRANMSMLTPDFRAKMVWGALAESFESGVKRNVQVETDFE